MAARIEGHLRLDSCGLLWSFYCGFADKTVAKAAWMGTGTRPRALSIQTKATFNITKGSVSLGTGGVSMDGSSTTNSCSLERDSVNATTIKQTLSGGRLCSFSGAWGVSAMYISAHVGAQVGTSFTYGDVHMNMVILGF